MSENIVRIDGSLGEGGGQVVRIAMCFSALYKIPIEIYNIRAGRPKPGLSAQHLKGVELVAKMCSAELIGATLGSTSLTFKPGSLLSKEETFIADTKTAGCIGLLIQIALPCALFASKAITCILKGGTNVPFGPQVEYLNYVFKPLLLRFGGNLELETIRKGYYPKGGGEVHMRVKPVHHLQGVELIDAGTITDIKGSSFVAGSLNLHIAEKMANDARTSIVKELSNKDIDVPSINIKAYKENYNFAVGQGSGINVMCTTSKECLFGGSGLGTKNQSPVPPGIEAANQLLAPILMDSCVDEHLQDQMIIFMVLAEGPSKIKIGKKGLTCHAETAKQVAEIMLANKGLSFSLNKNDNSSYVLECNGLGLTNKFINN